ncbi:DNA polymerase III subunit delta [Nocardioides mangrovicus]|uniref:DNA polymerase III subunit delta n=1 Tax=Nocardioides mangrovicus TaxID=2478913 RepID=UPI001E4D7AFD|nr:DNA polymerase III subunit delta [Nocardioides mangrovicus]
MADDGAAGLGGVLLVSGPEEFLAERTIGRVRTAVRALDAEAEFSETTADQLSLATLGELSAPSLFSSTRCVVVRRLEDLPEESTGGILAYAAAPAEDVALVLVHSGGQRGSGLLTKLRKVDGVREERTTSPKPSEYPRFVVSELRALNARIEPDAASALVAAVGQDLRGLASACHQLASDAAALGSGSGGRGTVIGSDLVKQYFGGRAEARSFDIADLTVGGRRAEALAELRWGLSTGLAPVLVTSAVSNSLRQLVKVGSAASGTRDADLARSVGMPDWKLKSVRAQLREWHPDALALAVRAVAVADADVKGQAADASYALERMVMTVADLRGRTG